MRIDDTDPDERDDLDRKVSLRTWLGIVAALLVVGGVVAVLLQLRGGADDAAAPTTLLPIEPDTVPLLEPDVVVVRPGDVVFPDFGSDYLGPQLELLFQRVTDTGIRVTLQDNGNWGGGGFARLDVAPGVAVPAGDAIAPPDTVGGGSGGWVPAEWCTPNGGFRLAMSYKDSVGVANGSRYAGPRDGTLTASLYSSGYADAVPFRVLVLQVAADVTLASATWADGSIDSAVPTNGFVVLASPGASDVQFDISLQAPAGPAEFLYDDLPRDGDLGWQKSCTPPPPELPPAGEQPSDAPGSEQQIRDNFDLLWDPDVAFEDKGGQLLDDTTGVQEAVDAVFAGGFADVARTATHTIDKLVFTSPTEAWFEYSLKTSISDFSGRFGIAYLIDGQWRFSRAVICQDLSLAGSQCDPFVDQIYPPGSAGSGGVGIGGGPAPTFIPSD